MECKHFLQEDVRGLVGLGKMSRMSENIRIWPKEGTCIRFFEITPICSFTGLSSMERLLLEITEVSTGVFECGG